MAFIRATSLSISGGHCFPIGWMLLTGSIVATE
jgi:hypothetical protein